MAISFSVDALIRQLVERGKAGREQVADYLDTVAADARSLADYWSGRLAEECQREAHAAEMHAGASLRLSAVVAGTSNVVSFSRLEHTYRDATLAFRGRLDTELQELFMSHLATLLQQRNRTRAAFEELAAALGSRRLLSYGGEPIRVNSLETLTDALQREAAAIEVLARRYRATM